MPAPRVIEPVDILEDGSFGLPTRFPSAPPDELGLDGFEESLDCGVVIAGIDRAVLSDWMGRTGALIAPVVDHMAMVLLKDSTRLHVDETTAPVLDPGRGKTKTGYFWAVLRDDKGWAGHVDMDSNLVENAIRSPAMTRRNTLFAGHDDGARCWARFASLIGTCRINGVEPYAYLFDLYTKLANGHLEKDSDALMPWA